MSDYMEWESPELSLDTGFTHSVVLSRVAERDRGPAEGRWKSVGVQTDGYFGGWKSRLLRRHTAVEDPFSPLGRYDLVFLVDDVRDSFVLSVVVRHILLRP